MISIMKECETIKRLNIQNDIHTSNKKPLCPLKPRKKHKKAIADKLISWMVSFLYYSKHERQEN